MAFSDMQGHGDVMVPGLRWMAEPRGDAIVTTNKESLLETKIAYFVESEEQDT